MVLWFLSLNSVFMVLKMAIFVGKVQSTETHIYFLSLNKIRIIVSQLLDVWLNTKLAKCNRFDSHWLCWRSWCKGIVSIVWVYKSWINTPGTKIINLRPFKPIGIVWKDRCFCHSRHVQFQTPVNVVPEFRYFRIENIIRSSSLENVWIDTVQKVDIFLVGVISKSFL